MTKREKLLKANPSQYPAEVERLIKQNHTLGDELALHRKAILALSQGQPLPQEFVDYYNEVEGVKQSVKNIIQGDD